MASESNRNVYHQKNYLTINIRWWYLVTRHVSSFVAATPPITIDFDHISWVMNPTQTQTNTNLNDSYSTRSIATIDFKFDAQNSGRIIMAWWKLIIAKYFAHLRLSEHFLSESWEFASYLSNLMIFLVRRTTLDLIKSRITLQIKFYWSISDLLELYAR